MISISAVTFWLVVTNIALGLLTLAFWLALIVGVIREMAERRVDHRATRRNGSGRMYISESGTIGEMRKGDLESISRN
jgi:hypothetical protein